MNKQRLAILGALLNGAKLPAGFKFDMGDYYSVAAPEEGSCNTVGCIAGLAVYVFGSRNGDWGHSQHDEAKKLLGLSAAEANELFLIKSLGGTGSDTGDVELTRVKKQQAATILLHAAKTGKIDWTKAGKLPVWK